jgi:hypothetical protein
MVSTPSLLDRTEIVHHADGRREYLVPGAQEEAAALEAHRAAYATHTAANEHEEAAAAKIRAIISSGPPCGAGDVLERHQQWTALARQQLEAATERRRLTADAAARVAAASRELEAIQGEVRLAIGLWAESQGDCTSRPDARIAEQETQRRIIREMEPLAIADAATVFSLEVARGVLNGLELLLPHRQVERLIVAELPGLQDRLRAAVSEG